MAGITECDDKAVTLGKDAGKQTEQGEKKKRFKLYLILQQLVTAVIQIPKGLKLDI